ncbi:MAG TPA: hypothetical protein VFQ30_06585 [Ktedonobacteraceae bacterium]|nr:hypothetical protein [Ktedonobacteraceae bacterium]
MPKTLAVEPFSLLSPSLVASLEILLAMQGRSIEVVNLTENPIEDIIADFVSILYSFCARLYGQRRAKRKTEKIVQNLNVQTPQPVLREVGEERAAR